MTGLQIPSPPPTPNGDLWLEIYRGDEGIQYCSEDGSATIWLSLVSDGRSRRWEWNSHEVIVGINMWELRESWERGRDDTLLVPPEPEPVHRGVPVSRDERFRSYAERKAEPAPDPVVPQGRSQFDAEEYHLKDRAVGDRSVGVQPEPEPTPVEVPVPGEVERNARALADAVRSRGRTYRELFHGRVPASYEPDVAYAVSQGWVVTDGDVVRLGPVDSRLPEPVGDMSLSGGRGWSRLFG